MSPISFIPLGDTPNYISSGNTLMDIRIIILKTIAKVWQDDRSNAGRLRKYLENCTQEEIKIWFWCTFGYLIPFPNFGFKFIQHQAKWNLYGDQTWTKHQREIIKITLPRMPENSKWDEYTKAEKLMEYYGYFPTFFGSIYPHSIDFTIDGNFPDKEKLSKLLIDYSKSSGSSYDASGNDYDLGISQDPFLSFSDVLVKLVAAIWEDSNLIKELDFNQYDVEDSKEIYPKKIKKILRKYFKYEIPWRFNILFIFPKDKSEEFWIKNGKKTDENGNTVTTWKWNHANSAQAINPITPISISVPLVRNTVFIEIPYAPTETESASLALARYNATGPAYPFTCS